MRNVTKSKHNEKVRRESNFKLKLILEIMKTEIKLLQEQLDYNLRHAKDLATFSDAYSIKRRAHCLDEAARLEKRIANLNTK